MIYRNEIIIILTEKLEPLESAERIPKAEKRFDELLGRSEKK